MGIYVKPASCDSALSAIVILAAPVGVGLLVADCEKSIADCSCRDGHHRAVSHFVLGVVAKVGSWVSGHMVLPDPSAVVECDANPGFGIRTPDVSVIDRSGRTRGGVGP